MYNGIGKKIKRLAKGVFVGETIISTIAAIALLICKTIMIGLLVLFLGPVVALFSSWLVYGLGEKIDK